MQILLIIFLFLIAAAVSLYSIGEKEYAGFLLQVITAFGVISAVAMAVYGERIKRLWNKIDLSIENPEESNNFSDEIITDSGKTKVLCHHLRVRNKTPTQPVTNCRVWLVKILDENDSGGFEENFKFAVPRLMGWAPREYSPEVRSFSEDQVFDFGRSFVERGGRFEVSPLGQGGMFKGDCLAGQKRQYLFKITADNYIKAGLITVEVYVEHRDTTSDWPHLTRTRVEVKRQPRRATNL